MMRMRYMYNCLLTVGHALIGGGSSSGAGTSTIDSIEGDCEVTGAVQTSNDICAVCCVDGCGHTEQVVVVTFLCI